jgi:transcriptional regulator with XRE-family HTH domain
MAEPLNGLRERRLFRNITQTQAAAIVDVNQSHYRQFETGQTRLDVHRAKRLADHFGCTMEDLL